MPIKKIIPGKMLKCPEGYHAFIPDPLPPFIDWNLELIRALSKADNLIGRLDVSKNNWCFQTQEGEVKYKLKKAYDDGTAYLLMSRTELLDRIASM